MIPASPAVTDNSVRPAHLNSISPDRVVTADVRDELRAGREPFTIIMAALRTVPDGGALCVRAIFEPAPLYAVMGRQGLLHWTEHRADDDWLVWFYAQPAGTASVPSALSPATAADAPAAVPAHSAPDSDVILDVRGLEPPEPMVRTLAALEQLPNGATLVQLNVRVPEFLLPVLEERGYSYDIREQGDGIVRLFIRRKSDTVYALT